MKVGPIEFLRRLVGGNLQPAGNRVQIEDSNGNSNSSANPLYTASSTSAGSMTPTHTAVDVNGDTSVVGANPNRKYLMLQNDSDTDIYVNLAGATAAANQGVRIPMNGGAYEMFPAHDNLILGAIRANHAAGVAKRLLVTEGT